MRKKIAVIVSIEFSPLGSMDTIIDKLNATEYNIIIFVLIRKLFQGTRLYIKGILRRLASKCALLCISMMNVVHSR